MTSRSADTRRQLTAELETQCLRALCDEYDAVNRDLFGKALTRPSLLLSETTARLGLWQQLPPTISLSRRLVVERPWGLVVEVLKHEMAHQFVSSVLGIEEAPHGPEFQRVCRERGIDSRAAGVLDSGAGAPHPVLSKVQRLLALAESMNSHEAEVAMSTAQKLMLKYNLDQVHTIEQRGYRVAQLGTPTGRVGESSRLLSAILREFFFVETLWVSAWRPLEAQWGSVLEVCGTAENVELAEYVHGFLLHTGERLWREHQRQRGISGNRDRRKFIAGMMSGFYAKLRRERGVHQAAGLVWLGDAELNAFFRRRHPRTRGISYRSSRGSLAYGEGRKAGEHIVLHKGVASGPRGEVRLLKG